jgi:hypothetical protein
VFGEDEFRQAIRHRIGKYEKEWFWKAGAREIPADSQFWIKTR